MAIYTGVANENGDFTVPFSSSYTNGQKVTVTAEKDSATKSIELFAPSEVTGGGNILFSGNLTNFPLNIGSLTFKGFVGVIQNSAFRPQTAGTGFSSASGITFGDNATTEIGSSCFFSWNKLTFIKLSESIEKLSNSSFQASVVNTLIERITAPGVKEILASAFVNQQARYIDLGANLTSIAASAFSCDRCVELIVRATMPPTIQTNSFLGIGVVANMIIKVPSESVEAYKTAPNWSAFAARIQAI